MTTFTEARHTGEFILSEANGLRSRENGTLASGQDLVAGTVLELNVSNELIAFTADTDSGEDIEVEAAGILLAATDATGGAVEVAYIARDAEVNLKLLTYPNDNDQEAKTVASLALLGIIGRDD